MAYLMQLMAQHRGQRWRGARRVGQPAVYTNNDMANYDSDDVVEECL